jgi:hypothetical protein
MKELKKISRVSRQRENFLIISRVSHHRENFLIISRVSRHRDEVFLYHIFRPR